MRRAKNFAKGFESMFGGGKEKKWNKKGEAHAGTAADAEAARSRRSRQAAAAAAAPRPPPPPLRPSCDATTPQDAARLAATEARLRGRAAAAGRRRHATAPTAPTASAPQAGGAWAGPATPRQHPPTTRRSLLWPRWGLRRRRARRCARAAARSSVRSRRCRRAAAAAAARRRHAAAALGERRHLLARGSPRRRVRAPRRLGRLASGRALPGGEAALLRKLVGNVRDAPAEPKFRRVRLSNLKIAAARGCLEPLALLAACGFTLDATGEHAEMADAAAATRRRWSGRRSPTRRSRWPPRAGRPSRSALRM